MVGPPKKHFVPFIILSICVLLLYSHSHSSLPDPISREFVSADAPKPSPFTLTIKVLTFNRLGSLRRCLGSLAAADYLPGHPVNIHIFIDHFTVANDSLTDQKLRESREILTFVDEFQWRFGEKLVHYRTANVGLQAQWLEAWWPSSDDEFAFFVEDDLELSPLYYTFLRSLILNFYYNASNFSPSVYGASLQRPRFVPGKHGNKMQLDTNTQLFFYQLVGTWGQLLFPKPWKEFRLWYDEHKAKGIKPFLDGMVTTGWYKRMGERIWTPWFIKFIHARGYFNIYTKFSDEKALSVSHRDAGVNYGKTAGPDSQLLGANSLDLKFVEKQSLSDMKWYDFCFREVFPGRRVVRNLDDLEAVLHLVQNRETILLVTLFGASKSIISNLVCNFERLNIRNYMFIGPHSDFLFDLARRGHPVIDSNEFLGDVKAQKPNLFKESDVELMRDILVKAYVIKKSLEHKYNTWVLDGNTLFVDSDPLRTVDPALDFLAIENIELLVIKGSSSAQKLWDDDFVNNLAAAAGKVSAAEEGLRFMKVASKTLERRGAKFKQINGNEFSLKISEEEGEAASMELVGKKVGVVYWSADLGVGLIQKRLQELGLWAVDGDTSCKAVICHGS